MAKKKTSTAKRKEVRKGTAGKAAPRSRTATRQAAPKATKTARAQGESGRTPQRHPAQVSSPARASGTAPAGSVLLRPPRLDLPSPTPSPPPSRTPVAGPEDVQVQPVTRADYPEFRQLLLAERERLLQELATLGERLQQVEEIGLVEAANEDDYGDVASEAFEREKGFALETSVQGMLRMVEDALRKLDEGTYGVCERCGRPIGVERLRALPFASLCIRCKAEQERESGSGNGWSG